jgi:dimethylhistidine N-methyltransferase
MEAVQAATLEVDVVEGLSRQSKVIPAKWLYDARGIELFRELTERREHYLTSAEARLLGELAPQLPDEIGEIRRLVEFGRGGTRRNTKSLIETVRTIVRYVPVDTSAEFVHSVASEIVRSVARLNVQPIAADFSAKFDLRDESVGGLPTDSLGTLGYLPGAVIGNYASDEAILIMKQLGRALGNGSHLLLSLDTTQHPNVLVPAYNDEGDVAAEFHLNLLDRINRELGANFDLEGFHHIARYDHIHSSVDLHLLSVRDQQVSVAGKQLRLSTGETIQTQSFYKHSPVRFLSMARSAKWNLVRSWQDRGRTGYAMCLFRYGQV